MAKAPAGVGSGPGPDGWARLADAEWAAARASFESALGREETPEALEGLSWAAWWLDDAEVVFDARERAYHLYRLGGDRASAARMATWLAADQLEFRGAAAVAGGWLRRARRLLEGIETRPEHGWLAFHEGYLAHLAGGTARAAELGERAAQVGRRFDVPDLEMLGLSLQGTTLVACAEVDEGMRCLDEAKAMAGEATIPISGAWACCFLVTACTAVLDYQRASEWCDSIAEFAERYGSRYILAFCRAEYGAIHLWRGHWTEAEEMLEAAIQDFSRSRPAMLGGPLVALAELRRRQTRTEEAVQLLDRAGPSGAAQLCRARIALDQGQTARAVELGERLLRQAPAERTVDRAPVFEHLFRSRLARGELGVARLALDSLREVERLVGTEPLRAFTEAAEGLLEAAAGEHERARVLLEDAVDRFQRCGAPFEAAQARIELATSLLAMGRAEDAHGEAAAARDRLLELGATAEAMRAGRLVEDSIRVGCDGAGTSGLTRREREVLALLAEGSTNRQIAERLVVSEHTVHRHVTNLLRKLDLPSRTAAAARALRSGLLGDARGDATGQNRPSPGPAAHGRSGRSQGGRAGARWGDGCPLDPVPVVVEAAAPARTEELTQVVGRRDRRHEMTTDEQTTATTDTDRELKAGTRAAWALGDYHAFAKGTVWELGEVLVSACGISPGQRVLDVAAGTGNTAIRAAEAGADVVASDLTPENFDAGRREAATRGVELEWVEADAEALPFADDEFDAVTSSVGALFAPHHQAVADEMLRVCRPGGTIGMINFTPEGIISDFFGALAPYMPPPPAGALPPPLWGSEQHVRELFGERVDSLEMSRRHYVERAESPEAYVEMFKRTFGPVVATYASLAADPGRTAALDRDFLEFATRANRNSGDGAAEYPYEYLLVVARKRAATPIP